MTKPYYECHITMQQTDIIDDYRSIIEKTCTEIGWSFSAIENDIILGDGLKLYATHHFNDKFSESYVRTQLECAAVYLAQAGALIIRKKIEKVIFDERERIKI